MKIVVFSTDGICCRLIEKALPQHSITVVCQNPQSLETHHQNLRVVRADLEDAQSIATALAGQDAVVAALHSVSIGKETEAIVRAMRSSGVRRFIAITPPPKRTKQSFIGRFLSQFIEEAVAEVSAIEWLMKKSGLTWTIVRPPELTNTPATGQYRLTTEPHGTLSYADLIDFTLGELTGAEHAEEVVGLAT